MKTIYLCFFVALIACRQQREFARPTIDLSGQWQFALDTANQGMAASWWLKNLEDTIALPGTTDLAKKGFQANDSSTMHLHRRYRYEGKAWYRRKVVVPVSFRNKHIRLVLERAKTSKLWVDSVLIGDSHLLQTPQAFDVSATLTPGEHYITLLIDNDLKLTPYGAVHIYTDETQTNWNGVIGQLYLEATPKTYISDLQVYPDIKNKKIDIRLGMANGLQLDSISLELFSEKIGADKASKLSTRKITIACKAQQQLSYDLGEECQLWDEFDRPLYRLTVRIANDSISDEKTVPFGMRRFSVDGTQFSINDRKIFLRGKHDGGVFPLTGCAPANVDDWVRVFRIAKNWGINHYRFHSWCPPDAAFTAADQEGIYIQAELPFWGGLDNDTLATRMREEGMAMLRQYANHPSFVMFSHGNEIWGGLDRVEANLAAFKAYDDRPLYTMAANAGIGYIPPTASSDFFVAARTPYAGDTTLTHTRLTHAFADSRDGGILNTQMPSTEVNFDYAVAHMPIPLVSHEIGQYQVFPDYKEIGKYTGVLEARNLEMFHQRLVAAGMARQDSAFHRASGAWAALCYKAEMEAALRTHGMAGFQILDLQDYPGQGSALVGMLDAFMDSKNVVTPDVWKQSCNDVVLLLEFPKYCWTNTETFQASAVMANFSAGSVNKPVNWQITAPGGEVLTKGSFARPAAKSGASTALGNISFQLSGITKATKLNVHIAVEGTAWTNDYPIWVYPPATPVQPANDIIVAHQLSGDVLKQLQQGGNVLLFPKHANNKGNTVGGLFPPDFWNYGMFKSVSMNNHKPVSPGTLGLLMDPKHPLFANFPTDFYTNWQWFSIIKASTPLILDSIDSSFMPLVQVIDNLERNHKLGLIFECRVGAGKLLVCMAPLDEMKDKPDATQLYRSIVAYIQSPQFKPKDEISVDLLNALF